MNALLFCTRLLAESRFDADLSSIASRLILRPFTPPFAFSAPIRALHPVAEPSLADAATPVSDEMNPSVTALSVTPGVLPDWAPAPVARTPTVARPSAATPATTRRPCLRCSLILFPPKWYGPVDRAEVVLGAER